MAPTDQQVRRALAELQGAGAKGQQLELSIHPFPARMPRSVAEHLVRRLSRPSETVLDPMAGSGTTLITAARLGRKGLGFDRDPLAVLVARTATHGLDSEELDKVQTQILGRARARFRQLSLPVARGRLPQEDQQFLRYWFPSRSQKQLFSLAGAIEELSEGPERDFAWVVFSSLIIAKSAGASHALDISRSRPHKCTDKSIILPFDGWQRRFKAAVKRHPFIETKPRAEAQIQVGDARRLPLHDETVNLVLTSPPYLNAIDYLRAHKFSLVWMGHELADLRDLRGTMMGTERGLWIQDGLPSHFEKRLRDAVPVKRRRALLRRYLSDFQAFLAEVHRVLRPDGIAVLVVGRKIVADDHADAVQIVKDMAEATDLKLVGSCLRTLSAVRRSLPAPSHHESGPLNQRMRQEVLVALRK